mmetsp:Transcript_11714/g.34229  ORF Transcript_11714/g.34229 Transcript_11714/m.34229 type:complete len:249 (+) Transcript_11714:108-854(+)
MCAHRVLAAVHYVWKTPENFVLLNPVGKPAVCVVQHSRVCGPIHSQPPQLWYGAPVAIHDPCHEGVHPAGQRQRVSDVLPPEVPDRAQPHSALSVGVGNEVRESLRQCRVARPLGGAQTLRLSFPLPPLESRASAAHSGRVWQIQAQLLRVPGAGKGNCLEQVVGCIHLGQLLLRVILVVRLDILLIRLVLLGEGRGDVLGLIRVVRLDQEPDGRLEEGDVPEPVGHLHVLGYAFVVVELEHVHLAVH